jgi:hypothetical protein
MSGFGGAAKMSFHKKSDRRIDLRFIFALKSYEEANDERSQRDKIEEGV